MVIPALVTDYLAGLRQLPHPELDVVAAEGAAANLPLVDPQTGALLHALTLITGARRILEIGTAIGYSALWMATALAPGGMLITLERDPTRAASARDHFVTAGLNDRISVMIGEASRFLHKIAGPFDLIFQDGDKRQYESMLDRLVELLRPGGVLVTDNVLWSGEVVPGLVPQPTRNVEDTRAIAAYNQKLAADRRLYTAFLPVGDGAAVSVKRNVT